MALEAIVPNRPEIVVIDTSIFLNVLDVPGFNQNKDAVLKQLKVLIDRSHRLSMILPFASIIETGNHISHLADGHHRRSYADKFCQQVRLAINGDSPWAATSLYDSKTINEIISSFFDLSVGGASFADCSIIYEWSSLCRKYNNRRVYIWSLDRHLSSYDRI